EADFISVHTPLLPETHGLFNAAKFQRMKRTAFLINTSRGPVVDEAALVAALEDGKIAGAALDVYEKEPVIHPGLRRSNVVLAPLVGFEGVVSAPSLPRKTVPGLKYFAAGHPVPNGESWKAAEAILALLKRCDEKTLAFFLLSGGGSALVELPLDSKQTLEDVRQLHQALVSCGAGIDEINTMRKHLSAVKGGRLAAAAPQATKITLAVSDVPAGKES